MFIFMFSRFCKGVRLLLLPFGEAEGRLIGQMLADAFLHPDHVVPAAELVSALLESAGEGEAHVRVKVCAVAGEIFVLFLWPAEAGVQIQDAHLGQPTLKLGIKYPSQPHPARRRIDSKL